MAKTLKTAGELENLVITELRNNPDCAVITGVVVAPLDFPDIGNQLGILLQ